MFCSNDFTPPEVFTCDGFQNKERLSQKLFNMYRNKWLRNVMTKLSYTQKEAEEAFIRIHKRL